ncbi:MAG: hypothetical protein ACREOM_00405 [Candidatus Dormibacteraceae bacterium]
MRRAKEHLDAFDSASDAFFRDDPHTFVSQVGKKPDEYIVRIRGVKVVPVDMALIAGDAIFNMRSYLDHMTYAFWHSEDAQFPVFATSKSFDDWGRRRIKGTSDAFKALVEGLQPYQSGNGGKLNLLWLLNELSNADKHRTLHLSSVSLVGSGYRSLITRDCNVRMQSPIFKGMLKDGTEMCRVRIARTGPKPEMQVHLALALAICFNEFGPGRGQIVADMLLKIYEYIDSILPQFENIL